MSGWDPLVLFVLACNAVIVIGPREYVPLAGFGLIGAIVAVPLTGRLDIAIPIFAMSGAGAIVLCFRTMGMLVDNWLHPPTTEQVRIRPPPDDADRDQ